ncbi:hypothetical protein HY570_00080, partial [Candidatus Micrarchaeota archaeon]|nr:hypothetical protein [Candidatus Micrarchaeota archaeon]
MSEESSNENLKNSITCDSSSIISLTDSCLLHVLREVKRYLNGEYVITPAVKYECIDNALRIKQHELSALRLQQSLNRGLFTLAQPRELEQKTQEIMYIVNNVYFVKKKPIKILQKGEVELLALNSILNIHNMLVDERTTRTLIEAPESLRDHLEFEYNHSVEINEANLNKILTMTRGLS